MNKYIFLCLTALLLACSPPKQDNQVWIENEIVAYLKSSSHPVTTLHLEGKTEQRWFKTDNVHIQNRSCSGFQLDLVSKQDDQMPRRILASTILAFDTITHQIFETDFETGEFRSLK